MLRRLAGGTYDRWCCTTQTTPHLLLRLLSTSISTQLWSLHAPDQRSTSAAQCFLRRLQLQRPFRISQRRSRATSRLKGARSAWSQCQSQSQAPPLTQGRLAQSERRGLPSKRPLQLSRCLSGVNSVPPVSAQEAGYLLEAEVKNPSPGSILRSGSLVSGTALSLLPQGCCDRACATLPDSAGRTYRSLLLCMDGKTVFVIFVRRMIHTQMSMGFDHRVDRCGCLGSRENELVCTASFLDVRGSISLPRSLGNVSLESASQRTSSPRAFVHAFPI